MRIALVHYAAPPVIGGVERVIEQQARVLSDHGYEVVVVCGNEGAVVPGADVRILPELKANAAIDDAAATEVAQRLMEHLAGCETVLIHNMLTMPFNWAASEALATLSQQMTGVRFVNWVHDVDVDPETFAALEARIRHVAVSEVRRQEFCRKLAIPLEDCRLIPNGVDVLATLGLTPSVAEFARQKGLLSRDLVLLHPTRVLARKNIEKGLAVTAALRDLGCDAAYVVTGAPDPHRKESAAYAIGLLGTVQALRLEGAVHFVSDEFPVGNEDVASLYRLADALLFPSRSEGFGLPLLEAALHRLPVFCSDIPPHREVAGEYALFFDLESPPDEVARLVLDEMQSDRRNLIQRSVMRRFDWNHIFKEYLEPVIKER